MPKPVVGQRAYGVACYVCGFARGELYYIKVDDKVVPKHIECPTCSHCNMTFSPYDGELIFKHQYSGYYTHKSCPLCHKCGLPGTEDMYLYHNMHKSCLVCQLCGKGEDVDNWSIEESHDIKYAHRHCLSKVYCKEHNCYMPCVDYNSE